MTCSIINTSNIEQASDNTLNKSIVFVDGECVLCNNWVVFLAKQNKAGNILFSAIQGSTANRLLTGVNTSDPESIVYLRSGKIYTRSTAALYMLADCTWYWKPILIFLILPTFIRNSIYDLVARKRFKWFGRKSTCSLTSMPDLSRVLP